MSLFDIFMKSPNSERTDFCRAMGPKEIDSSFTTKITLFRVKYFFKNMFLKISKNMTVLLKKVKS